jgi:hypothetical protein
MEMLTQKYEFSYVLIHKHRTIHISCLQHILLSAARYIMNRFSYYSAYLTMSQIPFVFEHCVSLHTNWYLYSPVTNLMTSPWHSSIRNNIVLCFAIVHHILNIYLCGPNSAQFKLNTTDNFYVIALNDAVNL